MRAARWLMLVLLVAGGALAQDEATPPAAAEGEGEGQGATEAAAPPPEREPVEARKADVDMTRFQNAFDEQIAAEQAEITGQAENADSSGDGAGMVLPALQSIVVLLIICGAIIGFGYFAKRFGGRTPLLAGASMGKPLGRLYLDPKVVLHFVESGGRVLVIGVTQGSIALITEFQADQFHAMSGQTDSDNRDADAGAQEFLSALRQRQADSESVATPNDLDDLRGDLNRLKEFLRESQREAGR